MLVWHERFKGLNSAVYLVGINLAHFHGKFKPYLGASFYWLRTNRLTRPR